MIYRLNIAAFTLTPGVRATLEQVVGDRLLEKSRVTLHEGGLAGAVEFYHHNPTPQVLVVEEADDDQALLANLAALAEVCDASTRVIVIGQVNDIAVYRRLIQEGVSEYLVAPSSHRQVMDAILHIFADPQSAPRSKLIAFFGSRGGAGSSTVAQNVAWSLSKLLGDDVALVDLDVNFGTAALAFNAEIRQTVADALAHPDRMDAQLMDKALVRQDEHLQILPAPAELRTLLDGLDVEGLDRIMDLVRAQATAVLVDVPHQWSGWTQFLLTMADEVVITSRLDLASLRDCKNLLEFLAAKRSGAPAPKLVLNMLDAYKKTQLTPKDFEETLGQAPVAVLPFEPNLFGEAANNGLAIGASAKTHKVAEAFSNLGLSLIGRPQVAAKVKKADSGKDSLMALLQKMKLVKG